MILPTDRFTYEIVEDYIVAYSLDDSSYNYAFPNSRN